MDKVESIFKYVSIFFLFLILLTVILQIVSREIMYFPVSWTQEVAKYGFIWMSLIGASLGIRHVTHVSIDLLVELLPKKLQLYIDYFVHGIIIVFMIFLLYQSTIFLLDASSQISPILGISMSFIYVSLILFSILSILFSIEKILQIKQSTKH